jgi:hypothetical protein
MQRREGYIPARVTLTPQNQANSPRRRDSQLMPEDSSLAVPNLTPGVYSVEIFPNGPYYVQSARCGSLNLLEQSLTIAPGGGVQAIDIVLRDDFATLEGSVAIAGEDDSAMILVISENSQQQVRTVTVSRSEPGVGAARSTSFQISQLPPGAYRVLAVENREDFEYGKPELVRKYLFNAQAVTLAANQTAKVELELVHIGE